MGAIAASRNSDLACFMMGMSRVGADSIPIRVYIDKEDFSGYIRDAAQKNRDRQE